MLRDKLLPVSNMASSRSEENVYPNHFQHQMVSQCWISLQFYWDLCFCILLADVIAIVALPNLAECYCHILFTKCWQMLLPFVCGLFQKPFVWLFLGNCYNPCTICDRCYITSGVVCDWCLVTWCLWLMLLPLIALYIGRCCAMWCNTTFCCKRALNMPMADGIAICCLLLRLMLLPLF